VLELVLDVLIELLVLEDVLLVDTDLEVEELVEDVEIEVLLEVLLVEVVAVSR
jgi:hypothetical protein